MLCVMVNDVFKLLTVEILSVVCLKHRFVSIDGFLHFFFIFLIIFFVFKHIVHCLKFGAKVITFSVSLVFLLFTDAKTGENGSKYFVGCYLTGDSSKIMDSLS